MVELQKWECLVDYVSSDSIFVHMIDLTNRKNPDEVAEIPFEKISIDKSLLLVGSIFYWTIFESGISKFEMLPGIKFTKQEIEEIKKESMKFFEDTNYVA